MENIKSTVKKNLKLYRKNRKLTQQEVADYLGVKHNTVSAWEGGANSIDIEILIKLCRLYEVTLNDIYNENVESTTKEMEELTKEEKELLQLYRGATEKAKGMALPIILFLYAGVALWHFFLQVAYAYWCF